MQDKNISEIVSNILDHRIDEIHKMAEHELKKIDEMKNRMQEEVDICYQHIAMIERFKAP